MCTDHMTIFSSQFCTATRVEYFAAISTIFYVRPRLGDALRFGFNWMAVLMPPTYKSTCMHRRSTGEVYYMSGHYGCSVALKMPRLCCGVKDSPVVNNSRIGWPRTKLQQLDGACYLVVGTNRFDCFI